MTTFDDLDDLVGRTMPSPTSRPHQASRATPRSSTSWRRSVTRSGPRVRSWTTVPGRDGLPPWRQGYPYDAKLGSREYERTKRRLQIELLKLQG